MKKFIAMMALLTAGVASAQTANKQNISLFFRINRARVVV
jgi:hypothetical protein